MEIGTHIDAVEEQGRALVEAAGRAGLAAALPSCPEWDVRELLAHLGAVHRWAATFVREGTAATAGGKHPPLATAPAEGLLEWYAEGHAALVAALRAAPADLECWTFLPASSPLAFWARRQAHETAIHRADVEAALDTVPACDPELAADGVDELLTGLYGRPGGRLLADPPRSLRVRTDDVPGSWHVALGPESRTVTVGGDEPADCTIHGPAADVYLYVWNRRPASAPQVEGDADVLKLWQEKATVQWR
jgi:uncharacterized protein (TIGR03083 family)